MCDFRPIVGLVNAAGITMRASFVGGGMRVRDAFIAINACAAALCFPAPVGNADVGNTTSKRGNW